MKEHVKSIKTDLRIIIEFCTQTEFPQVTHNWCISPIEKYIYHIIDITSEIQELT